LMLLREIMNKRLTRLNCQYVFLRPLGKRVLVGQVLSGIGAIGFVIRIYSIRNYSKRYKTWMV